MDDSPGNTVARPFTLRDAMILVAAIALGAMGVRSRLNVWSDQQTNCWGAGGYTIGIVILIGPVLAALTAGFAVIRLLPPRPSRVELFRQPGFVAAFMAFGSTVLQLVRMSLINKLLHNTGWSPNDVWVSAIAKGGLGILAAWSALVLAGAWQGERSWVDRSLRLIAVIWLALGLTVSVMPAFEFWLGRHLFL